MVGLTPTEGDDPTSNATDGHLRPGQHHLPAKLVQWPVQALVQCLGLHHESAIDFDDLLCWCGADRPFRALWGDSAATAKLVVVMDSGFEQFFEESEPPLRRAFTAGFGGDLGRDAAAEALTYGWQHWERIKNMDNPRGYLYRVGDRWARRQRRARSPIEFPSGPGSDDHGFEPGLGPALADLSRRQRQAVVLVVGYGMSHADTAALMNLSRSSVQNHVERAMAKLRSELGVDP